MSTKAQGRGARQWAVCLSALLLAAAAVLPGRAQAADPATQDARALDEQVQQLKKEVVDLNRDLFKVEEDLLYPASTQTAVFLAVDVGTFFALDSVQVLIDGKEVANYLYKEPEVKALHRGGVQKLYLGNLRAGQHELVAYFTGKGPHERDYRRGVTVNFDKSAGTKYLELTISDHVASLQPEFVVRQWE
ncbi:MAG TPA: hypothetical protein VMT50_04235 [Steroidobacteraceae bacterium]|nr:hypothetical protein [Steroidobacteraceae bacterium]